MMIFKINGIKLIFNILIKKTSNLALHSKKIFNTCWNYVFHRSIHTQIISIRAEIAFLVVQYIP